MRILLADFRSLGLVAAVEENSFQTARLSIWRSTSEILWHFGRLGTKVLMKSSNETSVLCLRSHITTLRCSSTRVQFRDDDSDGVQRRDPGVSGLGDVDTSLWDFGGPSELEVSKGLLLKRKWMQEKKEKGRTLLSELSWCGMLWCCMYNLASDVRVGLII